MSRRTFSILITTIALITVLTPAQLVAQEAQVADPVAQAVAELMTNHAELGGEVAPGG